MFVGGQMVIGDRALAIPENPTNVVQALSGERIQASGTISNLNILAESLTDHHFTLSALGNAVFQLAGQTFTVADLGTNGHDGVSFTWPSYVTALDVGWEALDPSNALPVGAYVRSQIFGTANGITNGVLGTLTETKAGTSNYVTSADYSPLGASSYAVQAYYQGVLVAQVLHEKGTSLAVAANLSVTRDIDAPGFPSIDSARGGTHVSLGGLNVVCDHLYITPENVSFQGATTAFQIVASRVPSITFTTANESVLYQGFTNTSLGSATLVVLSNQLIVCNLGTNGQDGVSLEHIPGEGAAKGQAQEIEIHMKSPDASGTLPVGAFMQEQAMGITNGANGVLATLSVTKAGTTGYALAADFSPLGASNYVVQAYLQGALVAQVTNQTGMPIAQADKISPNFAFTHNPLNRPAYLSFSTDWGGSPAHLILTGGSIVSCDQLLVTPQNAASNGPPTALQITASQVPSFNITSVTFSTMMVHLDHMNQNAVLRWYGAGVLQISSDLNNWSDLPGAISPYTVSISGAKQFFRVKAPGP
jgi:hypothetical protein